MWPNQGEDFDVHSSFLERVQPPGVDPDASPCVCIPISTAWLAVITGALQQLIQPGAWDTTDANVRATVIGQAYDLLAIVANASACIPGADTPPNPQGVGTGQQACNIAGYLANGVIKEAINQAVQAINTDQTTLDYGKSIIGIIPGAGLLINLAITAFDLLYTAIQGGTLSDYQAALADPTLFSKITCAIYGATNGDGYVTQANFTSVVAAVGAVSYTHSDVISTIVSYLNHLGYSGLNQLQQAGALAVYDCSACGTGVATGPTAPLAPTEPPGSTAIGVGVQAGSVIAYIPAGYVNSLTDVVFPVPYTNGAIPYCVASGAGANPYTLVATHNVTPNGLTIACEITYPRADDDGLLVTWMCCPGDGTAGSGVPATGSCAVSGAASTGTYRSGEVRGSASTSS